MKIVLILWTIWLTNFHDGRSLGPTKPIIPGEVVFTSYEQCERYKEEQLDLMEKNGLIKRLDKNRAQWIFAFPDPMIGMWECKEVEAEGATMDDLVFLLGAKNELIRG